MFSILLNSLYLTQINIIQDQVLLFHFNITSDVAFRSASAAYSVGLSLGR